MLSFLRIFPLFYYLALNYGNIKGLERLTGIEPVSSDWKSEILAIELQAQIQDAFFRAGFIDSELY